MAAAVSFLGRQSWPKLPFDNNLQPRSFDWLFVGNNFKVKLRFQTRKILLQVSEKDLSFLVVVQWAAPLGKVQEL